jgi:MFS family permease
MSHTDMPGRRRYWIYLLLFFLAVINTADRAALSVAAHPIADEFGISTVGMGYLFSSVLWSYLFCLIPAGILADRLGTRAVTAGGIVLWSAATLLTGGAWSYHSVLPAD